jgi:hypothetical protein
MDIKAEQLAYWYLRLNGFLTTPGFVVHPDRGRNQETDVDLIGVRFPYRAENLIRPMEDDPRFSAVTEKTIIAVVEVKAGAMRLNGPWTNKERNNMLRVVRAIGPLPREETRLAARALYEEGLYQSQLYHVMLVCIGSRINTDLKDSHPAVPQITWPEILRFIYDRFRGYRNEKRSHGQWDQDGQNLWNVADTSRSYEAFLNAVRITG